MVGRLDDPSGNFVSKGDRDVGSSSRAVQKMKIRPAHTAGGDTDDHLSWFRRSESDVFGPQITGAVEAEREDGHGSTIRGR
jgi:hypothetical protein